MHVARIFEDNIFGGVSISTIELVKQVLWLLDFLQKLLVFEFACYYCNINVLLHLLVHLIGQSMINCLIFQEFLINTDL